MSVRKMVKRDFCTDFIEIDLTRTLLRNKIQIKKIKKLETQTKTRRVRKKRQQGHEHTSKTIGWFGVTKHTLSTYICVYCCNRSIFLGYAESW